MPDAIHVHPHDVRDEGASRVVEEITNRTGLRTIVAEVVTLEERHPYPRGQLPHNPRHSVIVSRATLEVPLAAGLFAGLSVRPLLSSAARAGEDYLQTLRAAAQPHGTAVIPWLKALNGAFAGEPEAICVRIVGGKPIATWLCPNRAETAEVVSRLAQGVLERHPATAVLLDRFRYPDWSGAEVAPERLLTCFCDTCRELMEKDGIDLVLLETELARLTALAHRDPRLLLTRGLPLPARDALEHWLAFRQKSITTLVTTVAERLRAWGRETGHFAGELWLNLWPPSFAPLLGQDYRALGTVCDGAKHFPYHRLGGGADLAGLVESIAGRERPALREEVFRALLALLRLPGAPTLESFLREGFPVEFVKRETALAKEAFGPGTPVFAGIQAWDTPLEEIGTACRAARNGGADGLFFYCYGWAGLEALDEIGRILAR